ncbi:5-dehydro-4-deoxyglucarate dehydratase [Nesterenkonia ebinurensis]|uniref:5-dehydro-4-deoxyglucarate dehydratase n=1 Tax=Nesterenkonia ebinurensis TaxID=2608252 RepID=UPI00123DE394|nr:5-dehydro-4-deoxyglucarate dehydratase [Nesterenkonia ebinurensis]
MTTLNFADAPLFFPITPFGQDGTVDREALTEHISRRLEAGPGGIFPACGTGEFHALSPAESREVVTVAAEVTSGAVPVVAGVGGSLGQVLESVRDLTATGADGFLLLPPYLVGGTQEGLFQYVKTVVSATELPVIVYHRANARFTAETVVRLMTELPNVVGLKDGVGDVALAQEIVLRALSVRADALFFNGLLTAEASQAAYAAIGVPLYSSAVFAAQPEIALAFYRAYQDGRPEVINRLLEEFYLPLVRLRDTTPGYAVSLIKAANRLRGQTVGSVRPPLVDPSPEHLQRLEQLLDHGLAVAAELA